VGIIASVTQPFCRDCSRARLSADGQLYTCLFASDAHDLRGVLRDGTDDAGIERSIAHIWGIRADRYSELRTLVTLSAGGADPGRVEMSRIGG
jgi:GTP 3',8-cyclase